MNFEIFSAEKTNNLEALMPGKAHPVRRTALALQPGESFIVLKKDWMAAYNPHLKVRKNAN